MSTSMITGSPIKLEIYLDWTVSRFPYNINSNILLRVLFCVNPLGSLFSPSVSPFVPSLWLLAPPLEIPLFSTIMTDDFFKLTVTGSAQAR